jgi:hypothetical protein
MFETKSLVPFCSHQQHLVEHDTILNVVIEPSALESIARETLDEMAMVNNANMPIFDSPTLGWYNTVGMDSYIRNTIGTTANDEIVYSSDIPSKHLFPL